MLDEQFFNDIDMGDASPEHKQQLIEQLTELVQNQMGQRIAGKLTDEQMDHFDELLSHDKDEEAFDYLLEVYPEYEQDLQEEVQRVKTAFVSDMNKLLDLYNNGDLAKPE